jgi:catechol 2,3-dioxygenase-like lactoylglutathione lyase family enzyme
MMTRISWRRSVKNARVTEMPTLRFSTVVLDAPDARELADFYRRLLGWETRAEEPDWILLKAPDGGTALSFQTVSPYTAPVWPEPGPNDQRMMLHLDFEVEDLDEAGAHAIAAGAQLHEFQPQDDTRVYLDPAGHPFCLWVAT